MDRLIRIIKDFSLKKEEFFQMYRIIFIGQEKLENSDFGVTGVQRSCNTTVMVICRFRVYNVNVKRRLQLISCSITILLHLRFGH